MEHPLTVYVTAQTLSDQLSNDEDRSRAAGRMRDAGAGRVVLESYRGGHSVAEPLLRDARDAFLHEGFEVLGGLMPVHGPGFGKRAEGVETRLGCFCYSSEDTVEALAEEVCKLARVCGEVVIDDAFLTSCRCGTCRAARGDRDWGAFRRDLLCEVARALTARARDANPAARIIVKFPQYYERYHRFGYDAARFPDIFDAVWQGAETRDPATADYGYVEPYEGYFNVRWMAACAGDRFEGAWFDSLDCDEQLFYGQAVETFLAAPKHVTIFCYGEDLFGGSMMRRVTDALPSLERLREIAAGPQGVHVILPPNSQGGRDLYLFDYLGMLGIPCIPATQPNPTMRSMMLTAHAMRDPAVVAAVPKALMAGRHVIATIGALAAVAENVELLEFFGYRPSGVSLGGPPVDAFVARGKRVPCKPPFRLAGDLDPVDASVLAWAEFDACERGLVAAPFITAKSFASGGRAVVWCIDTFGEEAFETRERLNVPVPCDLCGLPTPVADMLRQTATSALRFRVSCPPRVSMYLFKNHAVFVNHRATVAEVAIQGLPLEADSLETDSPKTACTPTGILLAPGSYAALKRQ